MSKTIWKFTLETTDIQRVEMPENAQILCIQTQNEEPCILALVEPKNATVKRTFEIFGTGHNVPSNAERNYVGTYQLRNGSLVFHCFELLRLL